MVAFPSLVAILGNGFPAYPTGDVAKDCRQNHDIASAFNAPISPSLSAAWRRRRIMSGKSLVTPVLDCFIQLPLYPECYQQGLTRVLPQWPNRDRQYEMVFVES